MIATEAFPIDQTSNPYAGEALAADPETTQIRETFDAIVAVIDEVVTPELKKELEVTNFGKVPAQFNDEHGGSPFPPNGPNR